MNIFITGKSQPSVTFDARPLLNASPSETCMLIDSFKLYFSVSNWGMKNESVIVEPGNIARHQLKANVTFWMAMQLQNCVLFTIKNRQK